VATNGVKENTVPVRRTEHPNVPSAHEKEFLNAFEISKAKENDFHASFL
jgi:hypothetical protein